VASTLAALSAPGLHALTLSATNTNAIAILMAHSPRCGGAPTTGGRVAPNENL